MPAAAKPVRRHVATEESTGGAPRASAYVCEAASCISAQAHEITARLNERCAEAGLTDVLIKRVGCLGLCAAGPLVEIAETAQLFEHVTPDSVDGIVTALKNVKPTDTRQPQGPFFEKQLRIVTENLGRIDPESLDDYVARGGYESLKRVLGGMTSTEVRDEITTSGLRGRGGAGYPTGLKWTTVAKAQGSQKYVVCNADEGDPGAFMDRSVLESDPFRVLEGMTIAAFAVHANEGYIYCRAEYPLAVARLRTAIRLAQRAGLLGTGIAETSFNFDIQIRLGAGAFVCGEETALIASIEGRRGTPRPRPPYRVVRVDRQWTE
jgi:bidirectional [NiFe] hydrogenase diaphorase subunit